MCGIAGFVGFDDDDLLRAMCSSITHRGPDEDGFYTAPGIGMAMRRLSIIDLQGGRQPIANEDRSVWVVFNGEIYNYEGLREKLKARGHRFATRSDTETIVHLYEDYGLEFAEHLRGMFSIALWDARKRRLVLVRDRIGEKPLYFSEDGEELLFGSEMKAILQRAGQRQADPQAVCEFMAAGYVPAPRTFYRDIKKLPPGHMLVREAGTTTISQYWKRSVNRQSGMSFGDAKEELRSLLSDTVRLCLKSDVEVGGFLSGGIDSSVIVALMCKHAARVKTFSVGYGGQASGYNELHHARRIADEFGTQHRELIIGADSSVELLPRILWHYDEPHGEPTSILVYLLSEFTRRSVKVALGGTGSDEIFHGYPRHAGIRLLGYYRRLPRLIRKVLVERIVARWPESTKGRDFAKRARMFVSGSELPPEDAYLSWISLLDRDVRARLFSRRIRTGAGDPAGEKFLRDHLADVDGRELLDCAADLDVEGYLPEFQLAYMDRMSMAHGLEVRSPFCDYKLVDFATSLPASFRLRRTRSKHILKEIAGDWIPKAIAERRKMGFDSPFGQWIKGELREFITSFLSREHIARSGLLNHETVSQLIGDHLSGRRNYSMQLWSILALEAWNRMYIEDGVTDGSAYRLADMRGAEAFASKSSCPPGVSRSDENAFSSQRSVAGESGWTRRRLWEQSPRFVRKAVGCALKVIPKSMVLGRRFRRQAAFAEKAQWWPGEQARGYQLAKLREVLALAYEKTTFYHDLFDSVGFKPGDLQSLEDMRRLPLIDRSMVVDHLDEMCTVSPDSPGIDYISTGGTSGSPLRFYAPASRSAIEYAYLTAGWSRIGYKLDTPMAVIRGRVVPPGRDGFLHEYDPLLRHHYYSNFHMNEDNMRRYISHMAAMGPCFLHAYPSSAASLARFVKAGRVAAPTNVQGVILESENLYPDQVEIIEDVFGARVFSSYGHSEKLVLAAFCEQSNNYHVWPTYGYCELLDENGDPVTTPGRRGEIVGTGFINTVTPFIRYRTGDYATYLGDRCEACGREHVVLGDVVGRWPQGDLVASDGSFISMTTLNLHDDTMEHIREYQFHQSAPGLATFRIVPARRLTGEEQQRILERANDRLQGQVRLELEIRPELEKTKMGKQLRVVQRIGQKQGERD